MNIYTTEDLTVTLSEGDVTIYLFDQQVITMTTEEYRAIMVAIDKAEKG